MCGLATAEIAAAFLVPEPTMAQRLVRAKRKIRQAGIAFRVPGREDLQARLSAVLRVVYLVFTEGHLAAGGDALIRGDLCDQAIRLARALAGAAARRARGDLGCSRCCCSPTRAGMPASVPLATWSCSPSRTAADGTAP